MATRNDVAVSCEQCGKALGYVVENGHKRWLCAECSLTGVVQVIGVTQPTGQE